MKKKILSVMLTLGLLFSLTGCNYSEVETEEKNKRGHFLYVCLRRGISKLDSCLSQRNKGDVCDK